MNALNDLIEAIKNGDEAKTRIILDGHPHIVNHYDDTGATPLHYATLNGFQNITRLLIEKGAVINSIDKEFGATPTGWAIEYLRELGGHLGIELEDLAYAISNGDVRWTQRFLQRFPGLKEATYKNGKTFRQLATESGNKEIIDLFLPPPPNHPSTP